MQRLKTMLNSIDLKGYPAYKGLKGSYDFGDYRLGIDKVQGDPFASPSRISLVVPQSTHAIPKEFYEQKHRRIAVKIIYSAWFVGKANHLILRQKDPAKAA